MKLLINLFLFVTIFSVIGCAQYDPETEIKMDDFVQKLENDTSLVVLDVRTPQELRGPLGKIDGVINIPVQQLEERINELEPYKDKEIAVICRTGNRSSKGTIILNENGYNAKNVLGGMTEYREKAEKESGN